MKPDDLEIPRSFELAAEQGMDCVFKTVQLREAHQNTAVLTVRGADGKKLTVQAASTGGGRIRVDSLNGVEVSFTGAFNTLVVHHQDVAGELSRITNELAVGGVNIANMSLCRNRRGGDVLTIIETDHKLQADVVQRIGSLYAVDDVTYYEKEDA
jgi:L-serine dehydratase